MAGAFRLVRRRAPTAELVLSPLETNGERLGVLCYPTDTALVLGSTEEESDVDLEACRAQGVQVLRRRSGGGSVLIVPGSLCWLDLFLPRGDPLFEEDVARASLVAGAPWAAALERLLGGQVELHGPKMEPSRFSRSACFSGLGPGEVLVSGKKAVGIAQRRDRAGAWYFSIAYLEQLSERHVGLLSLSAGDKAALLRELESTTASLSVGLLELEEAIARELEHGSAFEALSSTR